MSNRFTRTCLLGAGMALGMSGSSHADEKPIIIGMAIAQSGWMVPYDNGAKTAELAIEELNAKGGLLGRKVTTIYADTKSNAAQGAKAALELIEQGADLIVVSCDYDTGGPAALEAAKAGKISWSICAEDAKMGVQGIGPLAFTGDASAQLQGAAAAEWGFKKKGYKNFYVLDDTSIEYDKSVCFGFEVGVKHLDGAKIVGQDTFKNDDPSVASQVTRIKNMNPAPDAIELCSYSPGGAAAVRQMRAAGIKTPILAATSMDGNFWLDAVPGLSDFYYPVLGSIYGDDPRPAINDLITKYKAKYGAEPPESHTLPGYTMIQLYARAVTQANSVDSKQVVAALESFKDTPTLLGPFSFTKDLHIQTKFQYTMMSVDNGKHKALEPWTTTTPMTMNDLFRKSE